jgi:hypothetical protein
MHKNATKCNEPLRKWCKNKHGASKIIDTLETYHSASTISLKVVQQKHFGAKYKHSLIITNQSRADKEMLPTREHLSAKCYYNKTIKDQNN